MDPTVCRTTSQKRHTKPCRFFQKGTCPLSAERCDFAHVKIQILPVGYSSSHLRPVLAEQRDYGESFQQATCMSPVDPGTMQPVASSHTVLEADSRPLEDAASVAGRKVVPRHRLRGITSYAGLALASHGPGFSPHGSNLCYVPDRRAASLAPSTDGLVQLILQGGDSPTSDVPSLSDGESGPPSAACEAPELAERWPGSPSPISPVVYLNPPPGGFSPGVPFTLPGYCSWTAPKQEARSRRPGISSRKLKALKTKQCKFFKKDGRCPQGSLCTFIHDPSSIRAPLSSQESPIDDSSSAQSASSTEYNSEDDCGKKIYPITWRVIGGGVMMGGQREICARFREGGCPEGDDCQYAHLDEDGLDDRIEGPSSPIATPRASDFPQGQIADRSTKHLVASTSPIPELDHDVPPMILPGHRLLTTLGSREELPPRPFSTPPRVGSRTERTRLDG